AAAPPRRQFITTEQTLSWIAADLRQATPVDRPHLRYLTFSHLANAGYCDDELRTHRNALATVFSGGSTNPSRKPPQPIDPSGAVLKVDLRNCGWSPADWEAIASADPYTLDLNGSAAAEIRELLHSSLAYVRGDWLVWAASEVSLDDQWAQLPPAEHPSGDPNRHVAERFQRALDLTLVAAELGLETADLRVRVSRAPTDIGELLSPVLAPGGSIPRGTFAKAFGRICEGLGIGGRREIVPLNGRHLEITRRPLRQR
ncbi:MAG: hypothetical protein WD176_00200, partial [Pirellulales bacterium]